jgi:hypothetical protein
MFAAIIYGESRYPCRKCGAHALRRSRRRSVTDYLLSLLGLKPLRCYRCMRRCHALLYDERTCC